MTRDIVSQLQDLQEQDVAKNKNSIRWEVAKEIGEGTDYKHLEFQCLDPSFWMYHRF